MGFHIARSFNRALAKVLAGGLLGLALVSAGASNVFGLQAAPAKSGGKHTQILQGTPIRGAVRSGEVNLATLPPATPAMLQASAAASGRIPAPYLARQTAAQQDAYRQWALAHPGALPKASGGPAPSTHDPKTYGNGVGPVLLSSHDGLNSVDGGGLSATPDPALAAAPGYLLEGVNNVMEVYSTTYAMKYGPWTPNQLFKSVMYSGDTFRDPQITYDAERSRYLIAWLEISPKTGTNLLGYDYIDLAISNTSTPSPLTNFRVYQFAAIWIGGRSAYTYCDYPTLGYDYWGVYITCMIGSVVDGSFLGNAALGFSINRMLSGTLDGIWWDNVLTDLSCGTGCYYPAHYLSPTIEDGVPQAEWVTATDALYSVTSQNQTVCAITNTHALDAIPSGAHPTFTCVYTTLPLSYADPNPAVEPGTDQTLNFPLGYKQVAYRNGQLYFAMTMILTCNGNVHDGVLWAAITPQLTTLAANTPQHINGVVDAYSQAGAFCYSDADVFTPTLIADTEGDMTLVFTYSNSSSIYPSIGFTGRTAADAPGTMDQGTGGAPVVVGSQSTSIGNPYWGGYSTCALLTNLVTRGIVYCVGEYGGTHTPTGGWDTELYAIRTQ
jgi:hypothetical protein